MSVLPRPEYKAAYVEQMFGRIAPGYDRLNRAMTFGMDVAWREVAVQLVAPPAFGRALDVGTGTGDFLPLLAAWMPRGFAVGVDFSQPMMRAGLPKIQGERARFVNGDALELPFPDACFDVVTTGFTLRNVADLPRALGELLRVTRPGGRMACLEVARPRNGLLRLGHRLYFEGIVPLIGGALGGDAQAYRYLPQSARLFPPPPELAALMRAAGWADVRYRWLSLGAVAIHTGRRPT